MYSECPECDSEEETLKGEFGFHQYGGGSIMLQVETECENDECDHSAIYEKTLTKA